MNFSLKQLSWMFYFILHYHLLFRKKLLFSNVYISMNTILECLYMFFVEKGTINYVCTKLVGDEGCSKCVQLHSGGRRCHVSWVRMHLCYLFSCFWQHFCLILSCFISRNLTLTFIQKSCVHEKRLFSFNEIKNTNKI